MQIQPWQRKSFIERLKIPLYTHVETSRKGCTVRRDNNNIRTRTMNLTALSATILIGSLPAAAAVSMAQPPRPSSANGARVERDPAMRQASRRPGNRSPNLSGLVVSSALAFLLEEKTKRLQQSSLKLVKLIF
jgi:hypothetical protein